MGDMAMTDFETRANIFNVMLAEPMTAEEIAGLVMMLQQTRNETLTEAANICGFVWTDPLDPDADFALKLASLKIRGLVQKP